MSRQRETCATSPPSPEAGFTLVEALVAMVILIFGLMAVSNLFLVATSSTSVANQGTAATVAASEQLEIMRSTPWNALIAGGDLDNDVPTGTPPPCGGPVAGIYNCDADLPGVGRVHVRWLISSGPPGGTPAWTRVRYIQVQADGTGALAGARSRALFGMFRTCTSAGATAGGPCPDPPLGGGF